MSEHYFSGTAKWAKLKNPDKFGKWSINLYVDADTRKAIRATGSKLTAKEDDDGFFYTFGRKTRASWGEVNPPTVVLADGTPFDGLIGNGSKVTVKIEVYDFKAGVDAQGNAYAAGKGTRLVGVRVDELVVYQKPEETAPTASAGAPEGLPF